ncbi:MAG TPA: ABC transporter ATP-binding protein [Polyangiaceae bacterium]
MTSTAPLAQTGDLLELPSYLHQTPEVAAHFAELRSRRVALSIEHVGREYDSGNGPFKALGDVSHTVRQRELTCVIGPSGCGKSTLIRILAGLEQPTSGQVTVDGESVRGPGAERGMVFQNYTLFPWLTVKKNVMFGLKMKGVQPVRAEASARKWLELVGLERFADAYPSELSGGMKQRVAIARALANQPRILLMDEPFGALDAQTRCSMQSHLLRIWASVDVTIVFITHDLEEAIYLADRIVVLGANPGRILEVIEVPVPRPREPSQLLSAHFLATKKRLETLIYKPETSDISSAGQAA